MRIVLIGQAAFGEKALEKLADRKENVVAVYTPPDLKGKPNPLYDLSGKLNIPAFWHAGKWTTDFISDYKKLKPDLNVMAFVTDILPEDILKFPTLSSIQYHPSLLPKHRGGSAINWAIIKGETKTGVTIFWPDKGIDTGPILLQKEVDITPDDTVGSLYFNKLFPAGVEAILESITLIKTGKVPRILQDESQATYEGLCTEKETGIDWRQPAIKIYNLIRGSNPQPGAVTSFKGKKLKVFDSELVPDKAGAAPAAITDISAQGFLVSTQDGAILVKRVQPEGSQKINAVEFAHFADLHTGDMLGA